MKGIAFAQRLLRDTSVDDLATLNPGDRLEFLDAINGSLQKLHSLAPHHSKISVGSIRLAAPSTVSMGVTEGSNEFTIYAAVSADFGCTIRIPGDDIDNQVVDSNELLHPYAGPTGTVQAGIYHDAAILPEPYAELITRPQILETRRFLTHDRQRSAWNLTEQQRAVCEPRFFCVEPNARNNNPASPGIFRVDSLPGRSYRLEMQVLLAPARISFTDLLAGSGTAIPLRDEHIEGYMLPIARGMLTSSKLWRDKGTKADVRAEASEAERGYAIFISQTLATPANRVGTPVGF